MSRRVVKVSKRTRKVVASFDCAEQAAKESGMSGEYMRHVCREKLFQSGEYYYRYESEFCADESWEGKQNRPVERVDEYGRRSWYSSVPVAARECYLSKRGIYAAINRGRATLDGWTFAYAS